MGRGGRWGADLPGADTPLLGAPESDSELCAQLIVVATLVYFWARAKWHAAPRPGGL